MYEHHTEPLLTPAEFLRRVLRHGTLAAGLVAAALGLGICGYHFLGMLSWVDALLNASMILSGMGPVDPFHTQAIKIFAAAYALFSGLVFIGVASVLVAPFAHRLLHRLHHQPAA